MLFAAMLLGLNACIIDFDGDGNIGCVRGSGSTITETFSTDQFDGISLEIPATLYVTQAPEFSIEVEGYSNLINILDLRVRGGVLQIEFDDCVRNVDDFRIYITMPEIKELSISGSGEVISENTLVTDDLELSISGSGNMDLGLDSDDVRLSISGSGDALLEGLADDFEIQISGSGNVRAFRLEASNVDVDIAGSGDADVSASTSLKVRIAGSGDVRYKGSPDLDISISGSGEVINAN